LLSNMFVRFLRVTVHKFSCHLYCYILCKHIIVFISILLWHLACLVFYFHE
jgi:hypothetical protein